jgi:hypothetical protein
MWYKNLSLEEWEENATEEEIRYLHGDCNKWVVENYQKGDKVLTFFALNENCGFHHLIHCCIVRNGMYIDIRGSTNNFNALLEGFEDDYLDEYMNNYSYDTLEQFCFAMKKLGIQT